MRVFGKSSPPSVYQCWYESRSIHRSGPTAQRSVAGEPRSFSRDSWARSGSDGVAFGTLELDGIRTSGIEAAPAAAVDKPKDKPGAADPASGASVTSPAPRVRFDTNPVLDSLEKEKLAVAAVR